jgi:hypothetical protein
MASAGASGNVTVEDQRSYIKVETSRGKHPTEIHSALREIYAVKFYGLAYTLLDLKEGRQLFLCA